MAQKFVIFRQPGQVYASLKGGFVEFHKDLLDSRDECLGGGFFSIDESEKKIYLYDKSYDFGYPRFEFLKYIPDWFDGYKVYYYTLDREDAVSITELVKEELEIDENL